MATAPAPGTGMRSGSGSSGAGGKPRHGRPAPNREGGLRLRELVGVVGYVRRALALVWQTSRTVTIALAAGSVLAGAAPTAMAWTGKRLIDAVVHAAGSGDTADKRAALFWVGAELVLAIVLLAATACWRCCARSCARSSATASTSSSSTRPSTSSSPSSRTPRPTTC